MIKAMGLFGSRHPVQQQRYQNQGGEKSGCIPDIWAGKRSGVRLCIAYGEVRLARLAFKFKKKKSEYRILNFLPFTFKNVPCILRRVP